MFAVFDLVVAKGEQHISFSNACPCSRTVSNHLSNNRPANSVKLQFARSFFGDIAKECSEISDSPAAGWWQLHVVPWRLGDGGNR
jgi:hypothetical protein